MLELECISGRSSAPKLPNPRLFSSWKVALWNGWGVWRVLQDVLVGVLEGIFFGVRGCVSGCVSGCVRHCSYQKTSLSRDRTRRHRPSYRECVSGC